MNKRQAKKYKKKVDEGVNKKMCERILKMARKQGTFVLVDPIGNTADWLPKLAAHEGYSVKILN